MNAGTEPQVSLSRHTHRLYLLCVVSYIALIFLTVLWEGWLAPAAGVPPEMWLVIKSVPLLLPLFGLLHGKPYTYAWASLLVLLYLTEGIVLSYTFRAQPLSFHDTFGCALAETVLSAVFIVSAPFYARFRAAELRAG
ncbi:MAG: DUF2069 domain-containing protein [Pseudomonadota bacterium]|nr:DUF2069 domain-containing protein [Pseudomonadota bacterium]